MSKKLLIGGGAILAIILIVLGVQWYKSTDKYIGGDPEQISELAGWNVPKFTVESSNVSETGNEYSWDLKLVKPLSEKKLKKLQKRVAKDENWTYDEATSKYSYKGEVNGRNVTIDVDVNAGKVNMLYACPK
ncbi:MAG: hypothetical protein MJZ74_01425 [Muribaculaceae bacterium]|nr:hypothetical protein [Muribaculaceae bacterium]